MARGRKGNKQPYFDDNEGRKYLTVYRPYPMNANMEIEADRMAFAYWIASCIGRDNLLAFFHKPRSPSMLIVEINGEFKDFKAILGEHRWSAFIRKPTNEEKKMSSQVFYCTYSTTREVEKYGWKRIDLLDEWFYSKENGIRWHPVNNVIVYPYPATERCDPPPEDPTRENLCRPLPVQQFKPPPPPRPPPVGSPAWNTMKEAESSGQPNRAATSRAQQQAYPIDPIPDNKPRNLAGWAQNRFPELGRSLPPGLVPRGPTTAPASIWSKGPPGLVRNLGGASSRSSGSEHGNSPSIPQTPQDDTPNETRSFSIGASMADDENDESDEDEDDKPRTYNVVQSTPEEPPVDEDNQKAQDNYNGPEPKSAKPKAMGDEFKCSYHLNGRCKPTICSDYAEWLRKQTRKQREEDRKAAQSNGKKGKTPVGAWRTTQDAHRGRRGSAAEWADSLPPGERDGAPHLSPPRSGSSSSSTERSPSASSERSSPAPVGRGRRQRNMPEAKVPPARPDNLKRPSAKANVTSPPPQRPPHLMKPGSGSANGNTLPKTNTPPTPSTPAPPVPAGLRKNANGNGSVAKTGSATAAKTGSATAAKTAQLPKGKGIASPSTPVSPPPSANVHSGGIRQWVEQVGQHSGSAAGSSRPAHHKGNGDLSYNKNNGNNDDAKSEGGWSVVSQGLGLWGAVDPNKDINNDVKSRAAWGDPSKSKGLWPGGVDIKPQRDDDEKSMAAWSAASMGEGVWGAVKPKDDDAVSVASTAAPTNSAKARSAASKGKGKANSNKNKKDNAKVQNLVQNGSKPGPVAGPTPAAKPLFQPPPTKLSWADEMEREERGEDDARSVASESGGWGSVSNGPW
ncbi:uncharacterized protein C8Q71DRAFT_774092 [Rhodofomes roseus]|uniref:Uncharacterized protein n=1 Tax=Rhodofomes roseus TaxID=34475 RepID=A0ABQ8K8L8_9APHY|nr:uncharacterized protein C8Q71DRAFT_774092 [Rhodofomes roseus]KAH9833596.1 hypothetical protein C8Q71DRAFT_774092 [Rhodofomes roseus]